MFSLLTFADPGHGMCELVHAQVRVDDVKRGGGVIVHGGRGEVDDLVRQLQRGVDSHAHTRDLKLPMEMRIIGKINLYSQDCVTKNEI